MSIHFPEICHRHFVNLSLLFWPKII